MNERQTAVLNLARFNKLVKELTYNICILGDVSLKDFAMELLDYEEWATSVLDYARKIQSPRFMEELYRLGKPKLLDDFLYESKGKIPDTEHEILSRIIEYLNDFDAIYQEYEKAAKGEFCQLVSLLANKEAMKLLDRSVKAGYLNKEYQPTAITDMYMLKIIAFAISKILQLPVRKTWATFEEQWHDAYHLSDIPNSNIQFEASKPVMELYPEVDFNELINPKDVYLTEKYGRDRVKAMFYELKRGGYIAKETPIDEFYSIFRLGKLNERVPVDWIKEQKLLVYFCYLAFSQTNNELWVKVQACFTINEKPINKESIKSCMVYLKKRKDFLTTDVRLRKIASDYVNG